MFKTRVKPWAAGERIQCKDSELFVLIRALRPNNFWRHKQMLGLMGF